MKHKHTLRLNLRLNWKIVFSWMKKIIELKIISVIIQLNVFSLSPLFQHKHSQRWIDCYLKAIKLFDTFGGFPHNSHKKWEAFLWFGDFLTDSQNKLNEKMIWNHLCVALKYGSDLKIKRTISESFWLSVWFVSQKP